MAAEKRMKRGSGVKSINGAAEAEAKQCGEAAIAERI